MSMSRLIDRIQYEVQSKNILGEVRYICVSRTAMEELMQDFKEQFVYEYMELGRQPAKDDILEYFNIPILIDDSSRAKKYCLLKTL